VQHPNNCILNMIHTIDKKAKTSRTHFDSVNEFISLMDSKAYKAHKEQTTCYISKDFTGVSNWSEAIDLQRQGYIPKGGFDLDISVSPTIEARDEFVMDYCGIFPDVAVYLSGEPMNMVNYVQQEAEVRVLKLAIQCNCNGMTDAKEMIKHSEEVFHAVRWAQSKGFQVELVALLYNDMGSVTETFTITLMKQGDVLSASRIAAAIHVSLFRCMWFTWAYAKYDSAGGSMNPPRIIDGYHVIPSTEFKRGKSVTDIVSNILHQQETSILA
jgi:hypothetical protein